MDHLPLHSFIDAMVTKNKKKMKERKTKTNKFHLYTCVFEKLACYTKEVGRSCNICYAKMKSCWTKSETSLTEWLRDSYECALCSVVSLFFSLSPCLFRIFCELFSILSIFMAVISIDRLQFLHIHFAHFTDWSTFVLLAFKFIANEWHSCDVLIENQLLNEDFFVIIRCIVQHNNHKTICHHGQIWLWGANWYVECCVQAQNSNHLTRQRFLLYVSKWCDIRSFDTAVP